MGRIDMWANYVCIFGGAAIAGTMCWSIWNAWTHERIYLGRSRQKWLTKAEDPHRFRINVLLNLAMIEAGLLLIAIGAGWWRP